ncbi:hypothetical protein ELQ92_03310 [Labedella populi]|uniref:Replicase polyprotein 1ab n=1 Tax=Labedella populi TaxID=2498850 RepID=A0A3S4E7R7_9MICO|nr:hypothetical protein [Labedella populi]RWZ68265.1 hypothetical protein ELQ92_03310 [Labedella populi]
MRPRHDDPEIPEDVQPRDLDKVARNELKSLTKDNADWVAKHLVMASRLIDEDPELAHAHALSAARRAGRIGVVRESLAITAYETGDYALALRELRTFRRISGSDEQLPLMVDSERGVGRPEKALELGRSVNRSTLTPATQVSLAIAMSGARLDLGSPELALGELEIPQLDPDRAFSYSPALYDAYAEVLSELGRDADAALWRRRASVALQLLGDPDESETVEIVEEELPMDESDDTAVDGYASDDAVISDGDDDAFDIPADDIAATDDAVIEADEADVAGSAEEAVRPNEADEADKTDAAVETDAADETGEEDEDGAVRPQED